MGLSVSQRKAYEARLHHLESAMIRLSGAYLTAVAQTPHMARILHDRLEAADIEMDLIREALEQDRAAPTA
ncbi:MAG TPA: hypothetical protein VD978_01250 [Azospirillum sp.]|nr:hypothetical protein [Azospirillum sp.]